MTIRKNSATVLASAILLAFAIPVLGQTQTQPQAQPKQTLSQAYQAARDYDAAYASAKQGLAAAKEKALQAKAGVRPTVNFVASGSQSDLAIVKPVTQRNYDTGGLTLSASYPLWRPANYQALSQAEKSVNIAEASYAQAGFDLMTRVSQAYFDVLLAQDTLTAIFEIGRAHV